MNDTGPGVGPGAWARHLSQPASGAPGPLSPAEARRVQRHLDRLQAAVNALSLQHHFLDDLLKKELPPLILWERTSVSV